MKKLFFLILVALAFSALPVGVYAQEETINFAFDDPIPVPEGYNKYMDGSLDNVKCKSPMGWTYCFTRDVYCGVEQNTGKFAMWWFIYHMSWGVEAEPVTVDTAQASFTDQDGQDQCDSILCVFIWGLPYGGATGQ